MPRQGKIDLISWAESDKDIRSPWKNREKHKGVICVEHKRGLQVNIN